MIELKRFRSSGCGHCSGYYGLAAAGDLSGDEGGQVADIQADFLERINSGKGLPQRSGAGRWNLAVGQCYVFFVRLGDLLEVS